MNEKPRFGLETGFLAGAALLLAVAELTPVHLFSPFEKLADFLPLHTFMETFAVVVACLIFSVGWHAYSKERPGNVILLACAFLGVGLLDFAHTLSYKGMPDFVTPSGPDKGIFFWLAGRWLEAAALLASSLLPWRPFASRSGRYLPLLATLALVAVIYWVGLFHPLWIPSFFVDGQGLTPFKVANEYAIIATLVGAAWLHLRRRSKEFDTHGLYLAASLTVLSEMSFTLYSHMSDLFNLLGHIYKVLAYGVLYRVIFIESVRLPYHRLAASRLEVMREKNRAQTAEEKIRTLNRELEQRVTERTAQLQAANQELEAFSYAVSHDLRAPLRSINGFCQILQKQYAESLDDKGQDYFHRVLAASQRMGGLIDGLLQLSRLGRGDIRKTRCDLSKIARSIADDLRHSAPERDVAFVIDANLSPDGDDHLLRILLENLIGNAWKFSAKNPAAKIEIGALSKEGEVTVYYVKDNGVGFDSQYADKLFTPFQRLHDAGEFEGFGIGLATVQRIVQRHGGRIWAESKPGAGAVFYFEL